MRWHCQQVGKLTGCHPRQKAGAAYDHADDPDPNDRQNEHRESAMP